MHGGVAIHDWPRKVNSNDFCCVTGINVGKGQQKGSPDVSHDSDTDKHGEDLIHYDKI